MKPLEVKNDAFNGVRIFGRGDSRRSCNKIYVEVKNAKVLSLLP